MLVFRFIKLVQGWNNTNILVAAKTSGDGGLSWGIPQDLLNL